MRSRPVATEVGEPAYTNAEAMADEPIAADELTDASPVGGAEADDAPVPRSFDPPEPRGRPQPATDPDLVRRARGGDTAAFEALYRAWHRRIYNFVYQMINNDGDAADLTQDVFVKLYESLPTLRVDEAFTSFLYRMTINLCRDHYRKHRRVSVDSLDQPRPSDDDDAPAMEIADSSGDPQLLVENTELQKRVQAAMATLSEDHRTVIILHHFQDRELVEIAKIMGCAEGTVKSRLARARDELKRKLRGYMGV